MPVHNALPHLDAAVESILGQSFADFEFVILDDASTDASRERLRYWAQRDSRIRLLEVDQNLGTVHASNMVANAARAPFVARMDADDISHADRLRQLFEVISADPDIGLVASLCDVIDGSGRKVRDSEIWRLTRKSPFLPFAHGAMMYRRELVERAGGYHEGCEYWEDQDLALRVAEIAKIAIIPRPLFRVRQWASTRVTCDQEELERAIQRILQITDGVKQGESYSRVFEAPPHFPSKLDPRVFIAVGSVQLWGGNTPHLFRRLLRRANLGWNFGSIAALVWTAWASIQPSSLRWFLKFLLLLRNHYASGRLQTDKPVFWRPLEPLIE